MRVRNTLLLLLVLLGLGAYVYWIDLPEAEKADRKEKLVEFEAEEITEIVLAHPDRETILGKTGSEWRLVSPVEAAADDVAVKALLSMMQSAEVTQVLDVDVTDLAPFGLAEPFASVTMKAGDRALAVVRVGKAAPVGAAVYARRGEEPKVLLTGSAVRSGLDKSVVDLRLKNILRFEDDTVEKVEIASADRALVLEKSGESWRITAPAEHAADATTVRSYLSTLRALRATDFPDETAALETYELAEPRLTVTVTFAGDAPAQALLVGGGNARKEVYVKLSSGPEVYTVGEWVGRDLDKPVDDFRDKTLLVFDKEEVTGIEVSGRDGDDYALGRAADGTWTLRGEDRPVVPLEVSQFLDDLVTFKGHAIAADGVSDLAPLGLDPPAVAIRLIGKDDAEIGTILLGQTEIDGNRQHVASRAGSGTVMEVRDYSYVRLDRPASDFLERLPVTPGAAGEEDEIDDEEFEEGDEDLDEDEEGPEFDVR
jgi:hypothetical protein